ncbi:MAG TPA: M20/M25/M40 family metallo-hydrolase [Dokdonella sp.]|uniref:M20/M25/M40 family metallo-hydrolase n=1 Tax=Dokdonella sp. TaxID=2291710 RepID=UPI002D7F2ABD|nr:M20/M25/M40 family metallo-hydrolase [Dokdonella sp.]HET9031962.1 M20/M25/M40 family metallo-hydrolase [Dokdonella sp.]
MKNCVAVLLFICFGLGTARAAVPDGVWLTLGEPAFQLMQQINPQVQVQASRAIESRRMPVAISEPVLVVRVSLDERNALAAAVHRELHHCGGFVAHASLADALAWLEPSSPAITPTRPGYDIDQQVRVLPMLADVSDSRIGADIQSLSAFQNRYYNGSHGAQAADWLVAQWQLIAAGRSDIQVNKVYRGADAMPSVVLTIEGTDLPGQILVLGAHLDSVNWRDAGGASQINARAPGADDDASGVAGLSEVLRAIVAHDFHPQRSIHLMAYSGEEVGLLGSAYLATDYANNQRDVVGVLQLDMTNYNGSDADITLIDDYTDAQQNDFLVQLVATYLPSLLVAHSECNYACSDHASWTQHGYAASFPFEAAFGEDNPWIHSTSDTWANSGSQALHARKFTRLALAWLGELAQEDPDRIFVSGFENQPMHSME